MLDGVLQGYNATVFAYGATGSGKTYTMLGTLDEPGIMYLALEALFEKIKNDKNFKYKITLSYLEVYNETIRDLLTEGNDYLELREDASKGVKVTGLTEIEAVDIKSVMSLLTKGNKNRTQEPTHQNEASSRSHAVLQVVVEQKDSTRDINEVIRIGKLSMIDLAGSERASVNQNRGMRLIEGANINRSLLALANCINALGEKHNKGSYVPYRDSKLTRLLKDSLGGNCRTVMIATVSPGITYVDDTVNTLKYANRAKNIKTKISRNVLKVSHHIAQYNKIIAELRDEVAHLKQQLSILQNDPKNSGNIEQMTETMSEFGKLREELISNFEERMHVRKSIAELEMLETKNSVLCNTIQVQISRWEQDNPDAKPSETPRPVKKSRKELSFLLQNMKKNAELKAQYQEQLKLLEKKGEKIREELNNKAKKLENKEYLELLYRLNLLELENMELMASSNVQASVIKDKELEVQKLKLQVKIRDKMIYSYRKILQEHGIQVNQQENYSLLKFNATRPFKRLDLLIENGAKRKLNFDAKSNYDGLESNVTSRTVSPVSSIYSDGSNKTVPVNGPMKNPSHSLPTLNGTSSLKKKTGLLKLKPPQIVEEKDISQQSPIQIKPISLTKPVRKDRRNSKLERRRRKKKLKLLQERQKLQILNLPIRSWHSPPVEENNKETEPVVIRKSSEIIKPKPSNSLTKINGTAILKGSKPNGAIIVTKLLKDKKAPLPVVQKTTKSEESNLPQVSLDGSYALINKKKSAEKRKKKLQLLKFKKPEKFPKLVNDSKVSPNRILHNTSPVQSISLKHYKTSLNNTVVK